MVWQAQCWQQLSAAWLSCLQLVQSQHMVFQMETFYGSVNTHVTDDRMSHTSLDLYDTGCNVGKWRSLSSPGAVLLIRVQMMVTWWAPQSDAPQCFVGPGQASDLMRLEPWLFCLVNAWYIWVYLLISLANKFVIYSAWAMLESASTVRDPWVQLYVVLVCTTATSGRPQQYCRVHDHA